MYAAFRSTFAWDMISDVLHVLFTRFNFLFCPCVVLKFYRSALSIL